MTRSETPEGTKKHRRRSASSLGAKEWAAETFDRANLLIAAWAGDLFMSNNFRVDLSDSSVSLVSGGAPSDASFELKWFRDEISSLSLNSIESQRKSGKSAGLVEEVDKAQILVKLTRSLENFAQKGQAAFFLLI